MSAERFYRGGQRSPFKASFTSGSLVASPSRGRANLLAVPAVTQERIKRLQVTLTIGATSSNLRGGWLAFLRVADEATIDITGLDLGDPHILRPKIWHTNADHAIYVELYLEAINLDAGETLFILGYGGVNTPVDYVAKWYSEESLR